jgi:hypothetical protein
MTGDITTHDDGSLTLVLKLSPEEARELESPLHDEEPVHRSLSSGRDYCVTCREGFYRGRREVVRAPSAAAAALKAFGICHAAFSLEPKR